MMVESQSLLMLPSFVGRNTSDNPEVPRSKTVGNVIPPAGPNVDDFMVESIWGDESECLRDRRCKIGGRPGEFGASATIGRRLRHWESVLRLSRLGFFLGPGILGLIKHGEEGSETKELFKAANGGCIDRPFMFLGFLGPGEVIGRSKLLIFVLRSIWRPSIFVGSSPKVVNGNEFKGMRFTGESGDDEGEGSDSEEVSVVRVGEESADSEFCVDVLS